MNKKIEYITKCGLKVLFLKKEGFHKVFCGIGVKYGSADTEFIIDGIKYKSPYGIAHFIEHKLFQMEDNSDAFSQFTRLNANSNAYTQNDKTIYYFNTSDDAYKPLALLLEMYFTPVFNEDAIELEKSIILNEIHMYDDNVNYKLFDNILNRLYPNDTYSYPITGLDEDVINTTANDLYLAYNSFYTPANSILTIVGDLDEKYLFNFIEEVLANLKFSNINAIKLPSVKSLNCLDSITVEEKISQNELLIGVRLNNISNLDSISCEKICAVLDSILSISSEFYMKLDELELITTDLDYQVVTHRDGAYIVILGPTEHGSKLADIIINKLKGLSMADLDLELIDLFLKYSKASSIKKLDSISSLGSNILSLALEDINYFDSINDIINLNISDLKPIIEAFNNGDYTYLYAKAKKC